jgi:hypothetical protein
MSAFVLDIAHHLEIGQFGQLGGEVRVNDLHSFTLGEIHATKSNCGTVPDELEIH